MDIRELEQAVKNGGIPAWATEETLQKLVQALGKKGTVGDFAKSIGRTGDTNPRTFIGGLNAASTGTTKLSKSAEVASKAVSGIKSVATGAAGIVGTLAQSRGKFADLNPIIDTLADGMSSVAGSIPIVGGFFKALIGFSAEIAKLNNVVLDDLLTNFRELGKQGFNLTTDLQSIQLAALDAGVQFQVLTGAVMENYAGMIAFGGSVDKATQRFAGSLAYLTDPNKPDSFAYAMQSFGYGAEEAAAFLGEFIERNRNSLRLQNMTDREVAEVAFDYAKNLRVIAELTGVQVDELKAAQMAQVADGAFQSKLQQMRNANMVDEAFAMEQFAGQLYAIDPAIASAYKEMVTFGNVATEQSALLMRTIPELAGAFAGQDIESARNAVAGLAKNTDALQIGTFALLDGPNSLSTLIANLVPTSQRLLGIVEGGVTKEELETEQQRQIDMLKGSVEALDSFNTDLLQAGTQIDVAAGKVQRAVIEQLEPAIQGQVELSNMFVENLNKFMSNPRGSLLGAFFNGEAQGADPNNLFSPKNNYGGGPAGGGLYMVGERGPELLRLSQGSMGHVYNHGQTKSMLRGRFGGGGVNGNIVDYFASGAYKQSHYPDLADREVSLGSGMGSLLMGPQGYPMEYSATLGGVTVGVHRDGYATIKQSMGGTARLIGVFDSFTKELKEMSVEDIATGRKSSNPEEMAEIGMQGLKGINGIPSKQDDPERYQQVYTDILMEIKKQTALMKRVLPKAMSSEGNF